MPLAGRFIKASRCKKIIGKRKVKEVPQSQNKAHPRHQEEEETDTIKQAHWKPQEKITQGKTSNKSPRRINHKVKKGKTNTGTTALVRSIEKITGGGLKHLYGQPTSPWSPV